MQMKMPSIPMREALHYMGWRGTPVEPRLLEQIEELIDLAEREVQPRTALRRFAMDGDGRLEGTTLIPRGEDVRRMLSGSGAAQPACGRGAVPDGPLQPRLRRHAAGADKGNLRGALRGQDHRAHGVTKRHHDPAQVGYSHHGDRPRAGLPQALGLRGMQHAGTLCTVQNQALAI